MDERIFQVNYRWRKGFMNVVFKGEDNAVKFAKDISFAKDGRHVTVRAMYWDKDSGMLRPDHRTYKPRVFVNDEERTVHATL